MPPELIFGGRGVGELFVGRNAGNLVDTATLGTVEYGAALISARRGQIGEKEWRRALDSLKEEADGSVVGRWISRFVRRT